MASVKKRKNLDFATKLKAIQRVEAGEKSSTVADDIGITRSKMSTLLKNKADIKAKAAEQRTSRGCHVRAPAHGKVEKALYAWFPLSGCRSTRTDAQADSSSDEEDCPDEAAATRAYSAAEVAAASGFILRCCGDMEGTGLSHLDSFDKIEASFF
ncbi:hypothetical protein HPB52_002831 [Rhipicephalus sanguineus]|uniref:HTH psq-type domain-containing protein n=1 Tax=Rhipicephalus sanguineus TaxID=34632 RepID=A0A9D4STG7_RHISA|nr:hypothetical protein HPB52_002831 [Rhipicephalus sanguineus]